MTAPDSYHPRLPGAWWVWNTVFMVAWFLTITVLTGSVVAGYGAAVGFVLGGVWGGIGYVLWAGKDREQPR